MDENTDLMQTLMDLGLSEDQIEAIMGLGSVAQEQTGLPSRMSMGERLYQTPEATGRWAGRVYRAANPMEHAAVGLDRLAGVKTMYDARKRGQTLRDEATRQRMMVLCARNPSMCSGRMGTPGAAPGATPSMGYNAMPPRGRGMV